MPWLPGGEKVISASFSAETPNSDSMPSRSIHGFLPIGFVSGLTWSSNVWLTGEVEHFFQLFGELEPGNQDPRPLRSGVVAGVDLEPGHLGGGYAAVPPANSHGITKGPLRVETNRRGHR